MSLSDPPMGASPRVIVTDAAARAIRTVVRQRGPVFFFESGGCGEASTPFCYPLGERVIGDRDVVFGFAEGFPVYLDGRYVGFWQESQLILDVAPGEPDGVSLPAGPGRHFVARAQIGAWSSAPLPVA
jgi:uncharacterized protein